MKAKTFLVIIVLVIVMITIIFFLLEPVYHVRLTTYLSVLGSLSILVLLGSFMLKVDSVEITRVNEEKKAERELLLSSYDRIISVMKSKTAIYSNLLSEMYPNQGILVDNNVDQQQRNNDEFYVSVLIFQLIENVHGFYLNKPERWSISSMGPKGEWYRTFVSWMSSPTLQKLWYNNKQFYQHGTVFFMNQILSDV